MNENVGSASGDPDHHTALPPLPVRPDYRHARWIGANLERCPRNIEQQSTPGFRSPHAIVVVGVCSSGKSTLVRSLREKGYRARAVAQEHSYVPYLWQRSKPDLLVYLDASLHTIRGRGRTRWRQGMLDDARHKLSHARQHCHLYIRTDGLLPEDVTSRVITFLAKQRPARSQVVVRS